MMTDQQDTLNPIVRTEVDFSISVFLYADGNVLVNRIGPS